MTTPRLIHSDASSFSLAPRSVPPEVVRRVEGGFREVIVIGDNFLPGSASNEELTRFPAAERRSPMRLLAITPFLGALGLALQPGTPTPQSTAKAPEPLRLPPKTAQPVVELILPAAVEKQTMIIGGVLYVDAATREAQI